MMNGFHFLYLFLVFNANKATHTVDQLSRGGKVSFILGQEKRHLLFVGSINGWRYVVATAKSVVEIVNAPTITSKC
jgi:hypothetical protein